MTSFKDNTGRSWTLSLTVAAVKRVRALCGVDIANIISLSPGDTPNTDLLERLASDPVLLVDVLYAICKPDADLFEISDTAFGEAMAGDAIELATAALLDEIVAFFPSAKRRLLQKIVEATRRFEVKTKAALEEVLANPDLDQALEAELAKWTNSSTPSQESLASIPPPTPSAP